MDVAAKLALPKELATMGITIIEEARAQIDIVLDAMPSPDDVTSIAALGLKRVRKDEGGRRFAGMASPLRVSALVVQLGGRLTVLEKERGPVESGSDGQFGGEQMVDAPAATTKLAISEEPTIATVSESLSDIGSTHTPSAEDASSKSSQAPAPSRPPHRVFPFRLVYVSRRAPGCDLPDTAARRGPELGIRRRLP